MTASTLTDDVTKISTHLEYANTALPCLRILLIPTIPK